MHEITVSREIPYPKADVWTAVDDFGNVARYHPEVRHSEATTETDRGLGARRVCEFYDGGQIREEVVGYEPERSVTIDIFDLGDLPMRTAIAVITVDAVDDERTRVTMSSHFHAKYGVLGRLVGRFVMAPRLRKTFEGVLEGLETHVGTGQDVGEGGTVARDAPNAASA